MTTRPYVHGYEALETSRLVDQARTLEDLLHAGTRYLAGSTVLEVGCGVGAQTLPLARNSPGASITSVDLSAASIAEARARVEAAGLANVTLAEADVFALPYGDAAFDHVFACFVLEHLARPVEALRRLAAALKPGGTLTLIEGDHGSAYFHPDSEAARHAISCQVALQAAAGGDALIGRRLYPLLVEAGFRNVGVAPRSVYVDASRPALAQGFIRETFTAMVAGVRDDAVAAGLTGPARFDAGVAALHRTAEPGGTFCYTFFKAVAERA